MAHAHDKQPYDRSFYDSFDESSLRSARHIVPYLVEWIGPDSVLDMGCGLGIWLSVFREQGVSRVLGLDGDYVDRERLFIPRDCFRAADLSNPPSPGDAFDLALSLEVAEHLPERVAQDVVDVLVSAAPYVLFSAAVPGQVGTHHVNMQWPDYWHERFARRGYRALDPLRPLLWHNEEVSLHYRQNLFLYAREDVKDPPGPPANTLTLVDVDILRGNEGLRASLAQLLRAVKRRLTGTTR